MNKVVVSSVATVFCSAVGTVDVANAADPASAGAITDCRDALANVRNIVEPLTATTRSFANGKIRVIHLDTGGEPVCCSSHLAILFPDSNDELAMRQCKLLSGTAAGHGFMALSVKGIRTSYDPARGLLLSVPVKHYADGAKPRETRVHIRINQTAGTVLIE